MVKRKNGRLILAICCFLLLLTSLSANAQHTAVKTNLLYWATTTPNLSVETRLSPKWTLDVTAGYNPFTFSDNRKLRHVLIQPEARYWFCSVFAGHFAGVNLLYSHYNVGGWHLPLGIFPDLKKYRFQGDLGAIGVSYGYSWMLSRRWSLEAEIGVGVGLTHYDKYECKHCGTKVGSDTRALVMPTKAGISLIYNIK